MEWICYNSQPLKIKFMTQQQEIKTFDDLSEKHKTWIIKYCSTTFELPLYLVWYSENDEDGTVKLMTYKNGEIFAAHSLANFKSNVLFEIDNLIVGENIISWLDNFSDLVIVESCTYNISEIENEIAKNNLDISTIENLVNFISVFDDLVHQDIKYLDLKTYIENDLIQETWDYFYDYIFWPRFNDKEKFEAWNRPELEIDTNELLIKLKQMVKAFEAYIKQI